MISRDTYMGMRSAMGGGYGALLAHKMLQHSDTPALVKAGIISSSAVGGGLAYKHLADLEDKLVRKAYDVVAQRRR